MLHGRRLRDTYCSRIQLNSHPTEGGTQVDVKKDKKKPEEEYFARVEFDKRQKALKEKQSRIQQEERTRLKEDHWMHCPKCGMEMVEITFEGIHVDKCSECLGIFFDNGEVDQLIEKNKHGFLSRMTSIFND
jgi:hypothetical protein